MLAERPTTHHDLRPIFPRSVGWLRRDQRYLSHSSNPSLIGHSRESSDNHSPKDRLMQAALHKNYCEILND